VLRVRSQGSRATVLSLLRNVLTILVLALAPLLIAQPVLAQSSDVWDASYWNNTTLSGPPVLGRQESAINYDWGSGSPDPSVAVDGFSARWTRYVDLAAGTYTFSATSDDGMRVWIDNQLVIDQWYDHPAETATVSKYMGQGQHWFVVEYYEDRGLAIASFSWQPTVNAAPSQAWSGEYFSNPDLSGSPVLVRSDADINFDWGAGSPDPRVPADYFSVRWTRELSLSAGPYLFTTQTDDGVRLYIDGSLVIDQWHPQVRTAYSASLYLAGGTHLVIMEYFEDTGVASAQLTWSGPTALADEGNLITCVPPYPSYSWIKAYQLMPDGTWLDVNRSGWASISKTGYLKIDGLPVSIVPYGQNGNPYWIQEWVNGQLVQSVGNTSLGQPPFVIVPGTDNLTPWQCPAH
jgi:hypothetical protein